MQPFHNPDCDCTPTEPCRLHDNARLVIRREVLAHILALGPTENPEPSCNLCLEAFTALDQAPFGAEPLPV
jgi:hypothetical protein